MYLGQSSGEPCGTGSCMVSGCMILWFPRSFRLSISAAPHQSMGTCSAVKHHAGQSSTKLRCAGDVQNKTCGSQQSSGMHYRLPLICVCLYSKSCNELHLYIMSAIKSVGNVSSDTPFLPLVPMGAGVKGGKLKGPRQSSRQPTRLSRLGNSVLAKMKNQPA